MWSTQGPARVPSLSRTSPCLMENRRSASSARPAVTLPSNQNVSERAARCDSQIRAKLLPKAHKRPGGPLSAVARTTRGMLETVYQQKLWWALTLIRFGRVQSAVARRALYAHPIQWSALCDCRNYYCTLRCTTAHLLCMSRSFFYFSCSPARIPEHTASNGTYR